MVYTPSKVESAEDFEIYYRQAYSGCIKKIYSFLTPFRQANSNEEQARRNSYRRSGDYKQI